MLKPINRPLRIALFADSFHETNGVATLSRQLTEFAQARELPFLVAYGGSQTRVTQAGSLATLELKRGPAAFPLDKNLYCDPLLIRHKQVVIDQLLAFKPDLIHVTGPGDLGFLGLFMAHTLHIPLVASWHTNLHEYLARRLNRALAAAPRKLRERAARIVERESLRGFLRFYQTARFVLAPNQGMVDLLHARTGKPAFLMRHGVDLAKYSTPPVGSHAGRPFCIGYVGRLTTEKNVRFFLELERTLLAAGQQNFTFLIVGEGGQQKWLQRHLLHAEFAGVLRGADLAGAYSRMDAFVFPSLTDTFGLVILEAMASGVPVIVAPETGQRVGIEDGVSGFLSQDFGISLLHLMRNHSQLICMSGAARKFACEHSWQSVFEQLYETYADGLSVDAELRALREIA